MAPLAPAELKRIEAKYSKGISSAEVVRIFQGRNERFSEATLRKYVQLGLLPTSRRVGIRGRHRGSSGLYPAVIVRMANQIKGALQAGKTLADIRRSAVSLAGDIELARHAVDSALAKINKGIQRAPKERRAALKKIFELHKKSFDGQIRRLHELVESLGKSIG